MDQDEDPVPCFAMTNQYEAILTHDPSGQCVRVTPDMPHSLKPQEDTPDVPDGTDILYPPDSGKAHLNQVSLWSKPPVGYYIYPDLEVDSYYIVIPPRPIQVVPYGKCRMANLDY